MRKILFLILATAIWFLPAYVMLVVLKTEFMPAIWMFSGWMPAILAVAYLEGKI